MKKIKGQVTARAMIIGFICCILLTASSFFIALKSSALPWPIMFASLLSLIILSGLGHTNYKEISVMHTVISAGSMVAGGFAFTVPAIYIIDPYAHIDLFMLIFVGIFGTILGLLFSMLFRHYFIDCSKMPFVMGKSAAKLIQSNKNHRLIKITIGSSFGIASIVGVLRDAILFIPSGFSFSQMTQFGSKAGFNFSLMLPAIGYLIGPAMVGVWFLGGCIGDFGFLIFGQLFGCIDQTVAYSLKSNVGLGWMIGTGVAIVVKEIFPNIKNFLMCVTFNSEDKANSICARLLAPVVVILSLYFIFFTNMPLAALAITVIGACLTTVMSAQCVGQAAINPMEVFGILVMSVVKFICPDISIVAVVFVAAVVVIACGLTGDLMNDYKSGQVFGTSPNAQWLGEAAGSILATLVVCIIFFVLVQAYGGSIFGSDVFPAAQSAAVAQLAGGVDNPIIFFSTAVISFIIYFVTPKLAILGLGIYLPFNLTLTVSVGAFIRLIFKFFISRAKKKKPESVLLILQNEGADICFASGLLAGEGVIGIAVTIVQAFLIISTL